MKTKKIINQGIDKTFGFIADNIVEISIAAGLVTSAGLLSTFAGLAKHAPVIGGGLSKAAGAMGKMAGLAGVLYASYEIVEAAAPGGELSATSLFGEGDVTSFLDTPISELFENWFGGDSQPTVITPQETEKMNQVISRDSYISNGNIDSGYAPYSTGQQKTRTLQPIVIQLDGQPFRDMIIDVTDEEAKQAIEDIKSPFKG